MRSLKMWYNPAMSRTRFELQAQATGTSARAGRLQTLHGEVLTPIFMPVGTQATVKSQTVESLKEAGSHVLLANTYHLLLRPGPEVFRKFGGIHRFMNWDGPVLTDSGGFQIFSLPHSREMNEEGARFQSYLDGTTHLLSPEKSIEMQKAIGSDIMMVLDQCIPSTADREQATAAMHLTHRWAARSLAARGDSPQSLFGIVQGACYEDLRKQSADTLTALPLDGFAIGGLAVGEGSKEREDTTELTAALLPKELPRYLMGVGTPYDILEAVHRGVDMFDCILPSQLAQRGAAYTSEGRLQLRRSQYKFSEEALDPDCGCSTCRQYSRAYLHHLYKSSEVLGWKLLTSHNLTFYHRLMRRMRSKILAGTFFDFYQASREKLASSDNTQTSRPPKRDPMKGLRLGDYEVHSSSESFFSIRQVTSGEIMHSVSDPCDEAHRLYVEQSDLATRLRFEGAPDLVVWDVGLGAATNAMAAVRCFEAMSPPVEGHPRRRLRILSFECDLDPLRLAIKYPGKFPHLRHKAPHILLKEGRYATEDGCLEWVLIPGDFLTTLNSAEAPDLVFFDPFSSKTDSRLWTSEVFLKITARAGAKPFELYTYSASTAVRAALLAAGLYIGKGAPTGPKLETTVAFHGAISRRTEGKPVEWLGEQWLDRWNRSHAKFPSDLPVEQHSVFEKRIRDHAQWNLGG